VIEVDPTESPFFVEEGLPSSTRFRVFVFTVSNRTINGVPNETESLPEIATVETLPGKFLVILQL